MHQFQYIQELFSTMSFATSPTTLSEIDWTADPVGAGGGPRKSISMGTIRANENVPVHSQKFTNLTSIANAGVSQPSLANRVPLDSNKETEPFEWTDREPKHDSTNMHFSRDVDDDRGGDAQSREYLSEYKKRFRPFSQYEYVDGKFFKKKGDQEIGSPWFQEVIELRKKAGEYRHRGWGTELAPQHMTEVYNQQLWDQVSRRSSLAALALITTTTQRLSKEEKEKENVKRSHPTRSASRPHTATPKHPLSDLRVDKQKDTETVQKKKPIDGTAAVNRAARAKARSQSAGPGGRSPRKSARQIVSSYGKTKEGPGGPGWKVQSDSGLVNSQAKPIQRHPRPSSADPSLGCYEPVVKSPPEPTRVKSPEQVDISKRAILMSPDPVNWTVPLDTSKSFTVTQNIREGERFHGGDGRSIRHPLSGQHSSAGSTMASSPISARSAPVPIHSSVGRPLQLGSSSSAPVITPYWKGHQSQKSQ
ncbi:Nuclear protein MDM1 [Orchesella cincta]|uniref:Nuclear protein MDM1 n=1 Tax=Orchesella cincta TaxID=48709 RepID=A0A1D2NI11_ORCCI|nr:Nuclear protein MDM1 [Orchesella cincta]